MFKCCFKSYLKLLHLVVMFAGLAIVGLGIYIAIDKPSADTHEIIPMPVVGILFSGCLITTVGISGYAGVLEEQPCTLYIFSAMQFVLGMAVLGAGLSFGFSIHAIHDVANKQVENEFQKSVSDIEYGLYDVCCALGLPTRLKCEYEWKLGCVYDPELYHDIRDQTDPNACQSLIHPEFCPSDNTTTEQFRMNVYNYFSKFLSVADVFSVLGCLLLVAFISSCCVACQRRKRAQRRQVILIGNHEPLLS